MSKIPPYLKKGDTIGIVAPSGYMPLDKMESCIDTLQDWGYKVKLGATTMSNSSCYFSGSDEERLADFQQMLDDREVNAILCARGGYGMSRIIDALNFKKFKKNPKWIIGFSDITVLHLHLYCKYNIASIHGPMAAAFNDGEQNNTYIENLKSTLEGHPADYECPVHPFNNPGKAKGALVGGNLSLLCHLIGTASDMNFRGKILFLEDIGEYTYNIDRMMLQYKRSGKFGHLKGLIIGGFTDNKDTERPFGKTVDEIIHDHIKEYKYPVCFHFPVSHEKENYTLKIGKEYLLNVSDDNVILKEN